MSTSQYAAYREQGYAVYHFESPLFRSKVERARDDATAALEARHGRFGSAARFKSESGLTYHFGEPNLRFASFRDLVRSDELSWAVRDIFGDRAVYMTHCKVSFKFVGAEQKWLPHQDLGYKPEERRGCTFAIFLEKCGAQNGTLEVFPGSQKLGRLPHRWRPGAGDLATQLCVDRVPDIEPRLVSGDIGDILCFDLATLHQSAPNTSHGTRSMFMIEVEPLGLYACDALGKPPVVLNGKMNWLSYSLSWASGARLRTRTFLLTCAIDLRERLRDAQPW